MFSLWAFTQQAFRYKHGPQNYLVGEYLRYSIRFGPVKAGEGIIELKQASLGGQDVLFVDALAKTTGLADRLYSVHDVFQSWFEPHSALSIQSVRDVKEGDYRFYNKFTFNRTDSSVYSQRSDTVFKIEPHTVDIIGLIYYARRINITGIGINEYIPITIFFDDELYPFDLRYKGVETIKTSFGDIKCHRFDPRVEEGRNFEDEDGMSLWVSADRNRIPVRIRFELRVGAIKCDLIEYNNLKYKLKTK